MLQTVSITSRVGPAIAVLIVLFFKSGVASAQSPTATLSGTIVDETGAAVADVAIVLVDAANGQRRQVTTAAEGTFVIPLLAPGRYSLAARRDGFAPLDVPSVVLKEHDAIGLHLELKVAGVIENVVVTAEKRQAHPFDVPVPVSVLDAVEADNLASTDQPLLRQYFSSVPALNVSPNITGAQMVTIRGVTTGDFTGPTVGILIDDVPLGGSTSYAGGDRVPDIDPGDLARIEVLRGPQGTLYGADSMGGLLKFVTKEPSFDKYSGRVEIGSSHVYNGAQPGFDIRASANLPLTPTFAMRMSGFKTQESGYIDNPVLNVDGVNSAQSFGGRLSALWQPRTDLSLKISGLYQSTHGDGLSEVTKQPGLGDLQQNYIAGVRQLERTVQSYSAVLKAKLGRVELTSITGYNNNWTLTPLDFTSYFGTLTQAEFGAPGAVLYYRDRTKKITQEVRLAAPMGRRFEWLAGTSYTHEHADFTSTVEAQDPLTGRSAGQFWFASFPNTFDEVAVFADLTYHMTNRFDIQVGGRQSRVNVTYLESLQEGPYTVVVLGASDPLVAPARAVNASPFTYLLTPRFKLSSDVMVYGRLASGFRPGVPNEAVGVNLVGSEPDRTYTYEIGFKGEFLDRRLAIDTSWYYIDWKDIQVQLFTPQFQGYWANGPGAKSEGLELSVVSRLLKGLTASGWAAYNNAVLTGPLPAASNAYGMPGDRLPLSSRASGNLSLQQTFPLWSGMTGFATGMVSLVGDRIGIFQQTPQRQVYPAYSKADLRAGVNVNSWSTSVFVNNVADSRGVLNGGIGYLPANAFLYIQPRTVGLSLSRSF